MSAEEKESHGVSDEDFGRSLAGDAIIRGDGRANHLSSQKSRRIQATSNVNVGIPALTTLSRFTVALQPLATGKIGLAVAAGGAQVKLTLTSLRFSSVRVIPGSTFNLVRAGEEPKRPAIDLSRLGVKSSGRQS